MHNCIGIQVWVSACKFDNSPLNCAVQFLIKTTMDKNSMIKVAVETQTVVFLLSSILDCLELFTV